MPGKPATEQKLQKVPVCLFALELALAAGMLLYAACSDHAVTAQPTAVQMNAATLSAVIIFAFLCLVAFTMLASLLVLGKRVGYDRRPTGYLVAFVLLSALWLLTESGVMAAFIRRQTVLRLLYYFSFYLMPVPFLLFIRSICRYGERLFRALFLLYGVSYIGNYVFMVANGLAFPPTLLLVHLLLIAAILTCLYACAKEYTRHKSRDALDVLLGMGAFSVASILGLVWFYVLKGGVYADFVGAGLLLFILCIAFGVVRRTISSVMAAQNFVSIAGAIPSGILLVKNDAQATLVYANDYYYRLFGYASPEEAARLGFDAARALRLPDGSSIAAYCRERAAEGMTQCEVEIHAADRDGRGLWLLNRLRFRPETDEIVCAAFDITERKRVEEKLRMSEEQYRLVLAQSGNMMCRFDVADRSVTMSPEVAAMFCAAERVVDVPETTIRQGNVAPESEAAFRKFYEEILHGGKTGAGTFCCRTAKGWRWLSARYTTVFTDDRKPAYAVVSFADVTEQREKELIYEKWKQEVASMPDERTAMFDWNLSRDVGGSETGGLLGGFRGITATSFNAYTAAYADRYVHERDRQQYLALVNRERLLGAYHEGDTSAEMDYRELVENGGFRFMHLTVQTVSYPDSGEVQAYLVFKDVDEEKRLQLATETQARRDPLTRLYNRAAFQAEVATLLETDDEGKQHAFVMIDIDNFKLVNDAFGHMAGDGYLAEVSGRLRSMLRQDDIIGRLGGDEFVVCMKGIASRENAAKRAESLCKALYQELSGGLTLSASIGVAMYPSDGDSFAVLYRRADVALYEAKRQGRNRYVFYTAQMETSAYVTNATPIDAAAAGETGEERH